MTAEQAPSHYRALVLDSVGADLRIEQRSMPDAVPGSVVVRILTTPVLSYQRDIYDGTRAYPFSTPIVGGGSAVARVVSVGPDATVLQPGKLVWVDCFVRGRDNSDAVLLWGIHEGSSESSKKLAHEVWHDGTYADIARVPLENCIPLDEDRLCAGGDKGLGYSPRDLIYLWYLTVPFGGLRSIDVKPGETVVVCPATGSFGGAGVHVAAALGARVIAMGRNGEELARLRTFVRKGIPSARIETVRITGDKDADTASLKAFGTIDAVLDLSPPAAAQSTHLLSAVAALRRGGRISIMGQVGLNIIDWDFLFKDLIAKAKLMYDREDLLLFVKMLEAGLFGRGADFVETKYFALEDWQKAFDEAATYTGVGRIVAFSL
ncbi:putative alcohol dehydrogenase protein [Seiridium cardinale]|uniref:Alcohol dehydrogenase protein n=1 Tax=Seiridium cardinale TaxID=138064 RepID=A0ABR2XHF8_9PEZI